MTRPAAPPALPSDAHKGDAGRVLCLAGSRRMPGAAALVARAAQRGGAGLVTLAALDPELLASVPCRAPEAVWIEPGDEEPAEVLVARADDVALAGPGLGATERTRRWVEGLLSVWSRALVLDADALNVLAGEPERIRDRTERSACVLTPHPGEAARLLGRPVPRDGAGREAAARELARRSGAVVCLKGAGTVVTDGERAEVNESGNPGLATAGAGDVLAGLLAAYLAAVNARWTSFDAARAAVHAHGRAGDLAAAELGRRALIASDLLDALPRAQRELERR